MNPQGAVLVRDRVSRFTGVGIGRMGALIHNAGSRNVNPTCGGGDGRASGSTQQEINERGGVLANSGRTGAANDLKATDVHSFHRRKAAPKSFRLVVGENRRAGSHR
jgi:hypothetical protein